MPDVDTTTLAKIKRAARDPATGNSITVPGDMSYADWYKQFVQGTHNDGGAKAGNAVKDNVGEKVPMGAKELTPANQSADEEKVEQIRTDIRNGVYPLTINAEKQSRHMPGENYVQGRSVITITLEELQELVNQFAGTGKILLNKRGEWKKQETVDFKCEIGYTINKEGAITKTSKAKLHYSKTGLHVVPYSGKE